MSEIKEKTFFTWNGWLFCNTIFVQEDDPENKDRTFKDSTKDPSKSMYRIEAIVGANQAYTKEMTTIRMTNIQGSFVVGVPFAIIAAMTNDVDGEGKLWEDEEMYKKVIRKTR